ncbi:MAG: response regulator [Pseudobacteriovorax sp.]|nr:response regulator [Pseudobacteriovorax sp.]
MSLGKILIVEDMEDTRFLVSRVLGRAGFSILEAKDGKTAEVSLSREGNIDLVILDIGLPDTDGYALAKKISKALNGCKICFMSGKKEKSEVLKAIACGGDDYIVKPVLPEQLLSRVGNLLDKEELVESYHQLECKMKANLVGSKIVPDIQIQAIGEAEVTVFSTARFADGTHLNVESPKLQALLKRSQSGVILRVSHCERQGYGRYLLQCHFVGLSEQESAQLRAFVIRGRYAA